MSEKGLCPCVPLTPPPPPPPPILPSTPSMDSSKSREQGKCHILNSPAQCLSAVEQGRKAVQNLHLQGQWSTQDCNDEIILSCYNPVKPVLQNGPVCGLVALSMASQLVKDCHATADDIFYEAQKRGFTKQGEIFSVSYMKELSSHFLNCTVEHLILGNDTDLEKSDFFLIVKHLLQRNVPLIPYDADKNHSPCQRRGHKAHWALLTGIVMAFQNSENVPKSVRTACIVDTEIPYLYHWPENPSMSLWEDLMSSAIASLSGKSGPLPCIRFYVYGHQGKSKHAGLWSLDDLLQSNAQLEEAGPERNIEDYVIPPEGVSVELKSQLLIVKLEKDG
ncbi:hypothetical protein EGW08_004591 [Elysia chlorotica]|uniref:Actin maturation protease n=1 Tax=Elysia chlorotica TaxID=188477 RepID=A0A433U1P5_ELYCH|nr:hypothetical protein EGW08_004591 [Elysia chlorotica]